MSIGVLGKVSFYRKQRWLILMKLQTIQAYEAAVAEFDCLWQAPPQKVSSARMAVLISAIQAWEEASLHENSVRANADETQAFSARRKVPGMSGKQGLMR